MVFNKKRHLLISTFFSPNDYNLLLIKINLFLLALSLYICINALFFDDYIMHVIHIEKGKYKLMYQIPIAFYSSLFSFAITTSLKKLSLTQNNIMNLKKKKNLKKC